MYCRNCGAKLNDGEKFCSKCGTSVEQTFSEKVHSAADKMNEFSKNLDDTVDSAVNDMKRDISRNNMVNTMLLKTDRNLIVVILLSIITCGIYNFYFVYCLAQDINIVCADDGDRTPGLATYVILSFVTCGFYSLYWEYKIANRIADNADRYNIQITQNGLHVLVWHLVGYLICMIGTFMGTYILIDNTNKICQAYNNSKLIS